MLMWEFRLLQIMNFGPSWCFMILNSNDLNQSSKVFLSNHWFGPVVLLSRWTIFSPGCPNLVCLVVYIRLLTISLHIHTPWLMCTLLKNFRSLSVLVSPHDNFSSTRIIDKVCCILVIDVCMRNCTHLLFPNYQKNCSRSLHPSLLLNKKCFS